MALQFYVVLALFFVSADACSCLPQVLKIQGHYYDSSIPRIVRAVVLREWPLVVPDQTVKKYYQLSVKQVFKGCIRNGVVWVSTPSNSALCGISLSVNSEYLLFLTGTVNQPETQLCLGNTLFKDVSAPNLAFLNSRNVCCGNVCNCATGKPPVRCFREPCSPPEKPPCKAAFKCINNYCGQCQAEWFNRSGLPACAAPDPII
jgi:hypothetical protein